MIPINGTLKIKQTSPDAWGVGTVTSAINIPAYISYKLVTRGDDANTTNSTLEGLPEGVAIMSGVIAVKQADSLEWEGLGGETLRARPKTVIYITDTSGIAKYTKVTY